VLAFQHARDNLSVAKLAVNVSRPNDLEFPLREVQPTLLKSWTDSLHCPALREEVLLANVDGNFYVIGDTCTHMGGTLSDGDLDGEQVQCPLHGAIFNVVTGEVLNPPARRGVQAYEARISGQDILVGPAKS